MSNYFTCWWCNEKGNSGEHKFKRTDLVNEFGETFKDSEDYPVLMRNGSEIKLQSAKSKFVKFPKVLCENCNNNRSQDFDLSYSLVLDMLIKDHLDYETREYIDFKAIFGDEWQKGKLDFYSYFVKHFCCRLAKNNIEIPFQVIKFLNRQAEYLEIMNFEFQHRLDLKKMIDLMVEEGYKDGYVALGSLYTKNDLNDNIEFAFSHLIRKWVRVNMFYSNAINKKNFKNLKSYYKSPVIPFKKITTIPLDQIVSYSDLSKSVYSNRINLEFNRDSIESVNEYFNANPYKKVDTNLL